MDPTETMVPTATPVPEHVPEHLMDPSTESTPLPPPPGDDPRLIEVGWLVVGALDPVDREAVEEARRDTLAALRRQFPDFDWQMPRVERRDLAQEVREEPVSLLDSGRAERDARHWDFALVISGSDLVAHEKSFALGVPSRALGVAVISTVRIDPKASGDDVPEGLPEDERRRIMARRLAALALHLFGHLNGLDHGGEPGSAMHDVSGVRDLDARGAFDEAQAERLAGELADVADLRLEERGARAPLPFYLQAAWENRDDVGSAIRLARPWMFPLRLSRLTTAACSALVVLLLTAETWDLAMNQHGGVVAALATVVLLATTAYVLHRQRLLVRRSRRLTEQTVIANVSLTCTVLLGLLVTWTGLFGLVLLAARTLYPRELVAEWAASLGAAPGLPHFLVLAGFVASLGLVIGALGASFEEENYIRHIAYVDEET